MDQPRRLQCRTAVGTTRGVWLCRDMVSPRKLGILTFHRSLNFGSYWQARCLVEGLRARGHDAELLDHDCDRVRLAELRCALQPELPRRTPRRRLKPYSAKVRKFSEATCTLPLSKRFS